MNENNKDILLLSDVIKDYEDRGYNYDGGLTLKDDFYLQFTHPTKGTVTYICKKVSDENIEQ